MDGEAEGVAAERVRSVKEEEATLPFGEGDEEK